MMSDSAVCMPRRAGAAHGHHHLPACRVVIRAGVFDSLGFASSCRNSAAATSPVQLPPSSASLIPNRCIEACSAATLPTKPCLPLLPSHDHSWQVGWIGSRQFLRFMRQHAKDCGMYLTSHR